MIIIDDNNTCKCGAYWQSNGYCCNGHPMEDVEDLNTNIEMLINENTKLESKISERDDLIKELQILIDELENELDELKRS